MQKQTKSILILIVIGSLAFGIGEAFAQDGTLTSDQVQLLQIVAVSSAVAGALVSVVNGWQNSTHTFSKKKAFSAILTAITGAMFLVNLGAVAEQTNGMTLFAIIIMYFIIGWGSDKGLSKLDKD